MSKGCSLGDPVACWSIWENTPAPASREAALRTFRAGCEADVPLYCAWLHSGLRKDGEAQYRAMILRHCLEIDIAACDHARGIPTREAHIAVAKILCRLDAKVCESMYQDIAISGEVVAIDTQHAAEAYEKNCLEGASLDGKPYESSKRARDCVAGSKLYSSTNWPGGPDRRRADALLTQACGLDLKAISAEERAEVEKHCRGSKLP
jgi:hypothetical protein